MKNTEVEHKKRTKQVEYLAQKFSKLQERLKKEDSGNDSEPVLKENVSKVMQQEERELTASEILHEEIVACKAKLKEEVALLSLGCSEPANFRHRIKVNLQKQVLDYLNNLNDKMSTEIDKVLEPMPRESKQVRDKVFLERKKPAANNAIITTLPIQRLHNTSLVETITEFEKYQAENGGI